MTTITTLAARITVLAIQGFMLDRPYLDVRKGAADSPTAAIDVLEVALRQNSNRLDLDFVGRIGQLLDLDQRVGRRIRAYVLCAHGSDFR